MTDRVPRILIIAGEASGDLYGAHLAARLKEHLPDADIMGVGGRKMRESGARILFDSSSWSAIGVAEALKVVPRLLLMLPRLCGVLKASPPDLVVLIDFGAFNLCVGKYLRSSRSKVLYFIPPGSWRRGATYRKLKGIPDVVVSPFPWSAETLRKEGFRAEFFGHPLLDVVKPGLSSGEFCGRFGFDLQRPIVGLLPGSRTQEIVNNLPAFVVAAGKILQLESGLQFAIPLAPSISFHAIASQLGGIPWVHVESYCLGDDPNSGTSRSCFSSIGRRIRALALEGGSVPGETRIKLIPGMAQDVLAHARAAVITSGTATLEAAILGCPMVIIYRGSRLTQLEYKLFGRGIKFIGLPNIILDRCVCPELIQEDASPGRIAEWMSKLISDTSDRTQMLSDLEEIKSILGNPGAIEKTARAVADLLESDSPVDS